jgi:hypothetical protein
MPELQFTDPPGFYRSAIYPPADFSSKEVNASLQVYPFRVFNGDIRQAFSRTLLRELIDGRYQETSILPGGRIDQMAMAGADAVLRARFQEGNYGQPREHLRVAVVRGNAVAIIDVSAISLASWQRIAPHIDAFAATLNIAAGSPPPASASSPPSAAGRAFAGLYMAITTKYEALFGRRVPAALYYLFSADGRVYRKYDDLSVPGNDPARFDFAAAQRADPVNSGRYTIQGNSVLVRLGPSSDPETFETTLPRGNTIVIRGLSFERQ